MKEQRRRSKKGGTEASQSKLGLRQSKNRKTNPICGKLKKWKTNPIFKIRLYLQLLKTKEDTAKAQGFIKKM